MEKTGQQTTRRSQHLDFFDGDQTTKAVGQWSQVQSAGCPAGISVGDAMDDDLRNRTQQHRGVHR